jgi:hypothetical protein
MPVISAVFASSSMARHRKALLAPIDQPHPLIVGLAQVWTDPCGLFEIQFAVFQISCLPLRNQHLRSPAMTAHVADLRRSPNFPDFCASPKYLDPDPVRRSVFKRLYSGKAVNS